MADQLIPLDVPGATAKVELKGAQGIFYTLYVDGNPIKRRKGVWTIPARGGTVSVVARGLLPGFQRLFAGETEIYRFGAHVTTVEKIVMFAPLLLVLHASTLALVLALLLFFSSVMFVKSDQVPRNLRVAMPLVNTIAGVMILFGLTAIAG